MPDITIRPSTPADLSALEALYPAAFPDEDLLPLVRDLLAGPAGVVSLVASDGPTIIGHIAFTLCGIEGADTRAALLAPLAVAPERQRQGIGAALISSGLDALRRDRVGPVLVLGDPAYYSRSGFRTETAIAPPYPLPKAWEPAWQSLRLDAGTETVRGKLLVPDLWMRPDLWGP